MKKNNNHSPGSRVYKKNKTEHERLDSPSFKKKQFKEDFIKTAKYEGKGSKKVLFVDRKEDRKSLSGNFFKGKDYYVKNKSHVEKNREKIIDNLNTTTNYTLNKFISHCGICSRRKAADLIKEGLIRVNDKVVLEPGLRLKKNQDIVTYKGQILSEKKNYVYILLNKPKDFITTTKDPQNRKTVFDIVKNATKERIFSVGRLDRNTTGVLILTNDGELTQKLTHPQFKVKKIYHVSLDKELSKSDFDKILKGVKIENEIAYVDALAYVDDKLRNEVGLEIHSGRNRIVRRIFEELGYDVVKLDRVLFAGLSKKNVKRGCWRFLSDKEVKYLQILNSSKYEKYRSNNITK